MGSLGLMEVWISNRAGDVEHCIVESLHCASGCLACCFPSGAVGQRGDWTQQESESVQQLKPLWLRLHSQAMLLGKETMIFGLFQDVGSLACLAGQEMCCLVSPACTVALQYPNGVGLLECP